MNSVMMVEPVEVTERRFMKVLQVCLAILADA